MLDVLTEQPIFDGVSSDHLDALDATVEEFGVGDDVIRRGGTADAMRVVLSGRVALSFGGGLPAATFETLGPGDILGLSWLREGGEWEFAGTAMLPTRVLSITAESLRSAMEGDLELSALIHQRLTKTLLDRLHAVRLQHLDLYRNPHARN
ncbi:MAG: cyclic nucleotide-binding domain-containing protein [Acidimicrobiia bacterium]|nr:cyclic nucleotide-binding domain-containing protein [Acidimicrobiia bacterium]